MASAESTPPTDPINPLHWYNRLGSPTPSGTVAAPVAGWQPQTDRGADNTEHLRPLQSHENSPRESAPVDKAIPWPPVRPEVLDACFMALRRMGDADARSVAVTSAARREGRTTVAVGLATASAAQHDRSTILLDLDVERGTIGLQGPVQSGPGVTDFINGDASLEDCLQRASDRLAIITAGTPCQLEDIVAPSGRLFDLIDELRDRCEVLIADLPPLSSGVVAARMADHFESVALVVRAGRVSVPNIEKSVAVLNQRPFVILNGEALTRSARLRRSFGRLRP
jgi:Mrp family chromosome partitioning ATPase